MADEMVPEAQDVGRSQGYSLLNQYYIKYDANNDDLYIFNQTFGYAFKKIYADEYNLKVVLPPGAQDVHASGWADV